VTAIQDGRALTSARLPRLMPGRSARLSADWAARVDTEGGPVALRLA
jgi:hypothetical protein